MPVSPGIDRTHGNYLNESIPQLDEVGLETYYGCMNTEVDMWLSINDLVLLEEQLLTSSPLPLYYQVALVLQDFIEIQRPPSGTPFFSDQEIAKALGVSRLTANRAVRALIERGCVSRQRGQRAQVCALHGLPILHMGELMSIGQTVEQAGGQLDTELLHRQRLRVPHRYVEQGLNLSADESVIRLRRTRSMEKQSVLLIESFLPSPQFDELLTCDQDVFREDLYSVMEWLAGVRPARVEREVWASRASVCIADTLHLLPWDPCLRIRSVSYDAGGSAVLMCDSWLNSLGCTLTSSLKSRDTSC